VQTITEQLRLRHCGDSLQDRALADLLDDVRRIADGVGAIHQLAITLTSPPAPPAPMKLSDEERRAMDAIECELIKAAICELSGVMVSPSVLATVYRLAAEAAVRR
jgi:hypothetical protein